MDETLETPQNGSSVLPKGRVKTAGRLARVAPERKRKGETVMDYKNFV